MMLDSGALIVVVVVVVLIVLQLWLRRPSQPSDRSLAMTVWAAFGPYDSAEAAGEALQRAVQATMRAEDTAAHQAWIVGHTRKFVEWERRGTFTKNEALTRRALNANARGPAFDEAHRRYRDLTEAPLLKSMGRLNRELLEKVGHKRRVPGRTRSPSLKPAPQQLADRGYRPILTPCAPTVLVVDDEHPSTLLDYC